MPGLVPSQQWLDFSRRLFKRLRGGDRFLIGACLTLPALKQVAALGSFWVSGRAIHLAITGGIPPEQEWSTGAGVFLSLAIASALLWIAGISEVRLKKCLYRLVRCIFAEVLAAFRTLPEEARSSALQEFRKGEAELLRKSVEFIFTFIALCGDLLLLAALSLMISYISPVIGIILILGGAFAMFLLRARAKRTVVDDGEKKVFQEELREAAIGLTKSDVKLEEAVKRYLLNPVDTMQQATFAQSTSQRGRTLALVGMAAALIITGLYFMAYEGALSQVDPFWVVIMVLALRNCLALGGGVLVKWNTLLSDRDALAKFRILVMDLA